MTIASRSGWSTLILSATSCALFLDVYSSYINSLTLFLLAFLIDILYFIFLSPLSYCNSFFCFGVFDFPRIIFVIGVSLCELLPTCEPLCFLNGIKFFDYLPIFPFKFLCSDLVSFHCSFSLSFSLYIVYQKIMNKFIHFL